MPRPWPGVDALLWLALLAMALRLPFATGYMADAGGYAAICPSGLSDAQAAFLLPGALHAGQGGLHAGMGHAGMPHAKTSHAGLGHAGVDPGKSPPHQHADASCDAALHAVAAFLPLHLAMLAPLAPRIATVLPQAAPPLPAHRRYQARGPPRLIGLPRPT